MFDSIGDAIATVRDFFSNTSVDHLPDDGTFAPGSHTLPADLHHALTDFAGQQSGSVAPADVEQLIQVIQDHGAQAPSALHDLFASGATTTVPVDQAQTGHDTARAALQIASGDGWGNSASATPGIHDAFLGDAECNGSVHIPEPNYTPLEAADASAAHIAHASSIHPAPDHPGAHTHEIKFCNGCDCGFTPATCGAGYACRWTY